MTGCTVISNAGMVEHRWDKSSTGDVTDITVLGGWNVAGRLADGAACATIMTGVAAFTYDIGTAMVDESIEEVSRVMAGTAIFIRVLVDRRIRHPSCTNSNVIDTSVVA